jgi:hypothetical protein
MKAVDFNELAKAVDEWREAMRLLKNRAQEVLSRMKEPSKPTEFLDQDTFNEYIAKHELWASSRLECWDIASTESESVHRAELSIYDMLEDYPDIHFVVTCKDGKKFYAKIYPSDGELCSREFNISITEL